MNQNPQSDPQLLGMLSGFDADAERSVALRARRSVLGRLLRNGEQRVQQRYNFGLALGAAACVLVLIAPVVWMIVDEVLDGEHPASLAPQLGILAILLTAALLTVLTAVLRENLRGRDGFRRR